jgi:hypothetical protein
MKNTLGLYQFQQVAQELMNKFFLTLPMFTDFCEFFTTKRISLIKEGSVYNANRPPAVKVFIAPA